MQKEGIGMESTIIVVTGGAKSGKSTFAEEYLAACSGIKAYVATAQALDAEMAARIDAHQQRRPAGWQTYEMPDNMSGQLPMVLTAADAVLIDCLTMYFSNYLLAHEQESDGAILDGAMAEMEKIIQDIRREKGRIVIFVTNELGSSIVPMGRISRLYRDLIGQINQYAAAEADAVYLTTCGIPVEIKSRRAVIPAGGRR